ncbi:hypothetical protein N9B83_00125 [Schleiferiaceae bacterium]|nr:hypothetical protein [Schleiferiaceae bacterium]
MSKSLSELVFYSYIIAYTLSLFAKIIPIFAFISYILYLGVYIAAFLILMLNRSWIVLVVIMAALASFNLDSYYVNDSIRLVGNMMIGSLSFSKFALNKRLIYFSLTGLFSFQLLDYFLILFPRDISIKNDAYGLWRSGNELAVFLVFLSYIIRSYFHRFIVVLSGYMAMVKFAIIAPVFTLIRKINISRFVLVVGVLVLAVNIILSGNPELNYLIYGKQFGWLDIITGLRFTRLMSNLDAIYYRLDTVRYFEMDVIDSYLMLGYIGVFICAVIYTKLYKIVRENVSMFLFLVLLLYSIFFGHVVSSTSFGLMLIYFKGVEDEGIFKERV